MMDNTAGVIKLLGADKVRYINIAVDITAQCDCVPSGGHPLVPDQGILYSADPVTVDQASRDLVANAKGLPGRGAPLKHAAHLHRDALDLGIYLKNIRLTQYPVIKPFCFEKEPVQMGTTRRVHFGAVKLECVDPGQTCVFRRALVAANVAFIVRFFKGGEAIGGPPARNCAEHPGLPRPT